MKSSRFAELVALIGFVIGGLIAMNARGGLHYLGAVIAIGSVVWYFKWGMQLSGWVGPTEAELHGKLKKIEREIEAVTANPAGPDRYKKEVELLNKKEALKRTRWELRDATSQLTANTVSAAASKTGGSEGRAVEVVSAIDPRYTYAFELMEATKGYMQIFRKGTEEKQAAKLNEIMGYMDELKAIDTWIEDVTKMTVAERAPLMERVAKTLARRVEILKLLFQVL